MGVRDEIVNRLRAIEGVVESASMFGPHDAFWCNGKEIAHFHGTDVIELRLTRAGLRALPPHLRADDRVELRSGSSEWIALHLTSNDDVGFVAELAERAAAAHRAGPGEKPKPVPTGADLDRRRRFH